MVRILLPLALALAAALTGCSDVEEAGDGRLRVVATTAIIGSLAEEVGGDHVDVTVLAKAGVDPHEYELTASNRRALEDADVILRNGLGLDSYIDSALGDGGARKRTVTVTDGVRLRHAGEHDHDDEHGDSEDDPHTWHDPANVKVMVDNIAAALAEADAPNADAYRGNAAAMDARLDQADAEIRAIIDTIPPANRKMVTNHDALGYFIDAYGLEFIGAVIPGTSSQAEPSAKRVRQLVDVIKASGVKAIFSESSVDPKVARQIAKDTGVRIVDDLYGDTLGEPGSGAETVDGMLVANAHKIAEALQ